MKDFSLKYEVPFAREVNFTQPEKELLQQYIKLRHLKRKEKILEAGNAETHFNFVHKGMMRQYYLHENREINTRFYTEGEIVCSIYSYFSHLPSDYSIEAVKPTTLISIETEHMDLLMSKGLNFTLFGRLLMAQLFLYKEEREKMLLNYDAPDRLRYFFETQPKLFAELPQVFIASYLNIRPETFSKLKKDILKSS